MKTIFFTINDFAIRENLFSGVRKDEINLPIILITNVIVDGDLSNSLHQTKTTIKLVTKNVLLEDNENRIFDEDTQMYIRQILNDPSSCGFVMYNEAVKDSALNLEESISYDIHLDIEQLNKVTDILKNQSLKLQIIVTAADFTNLASLKVPKAIYQVSYAISKNL